MASTYLTETTLGTATDATKFTYSAWVKRSSIPAGGSNDYELLMGSRPSHVDGHGGVWLWQNGEFAFYDYPSAGASALTTRTSAKLFDVNAWYHLQVTGDASQSGTDKLKFYINGVLQTEFAEDNRSSFATLAHSIHDTNHPVQIGGRDYSVHYYFSGYMSHVHFTDGYAYAASTFGSTDSTTGQWKINTSPSVTYGNNGFFILKDGNSVTDQSGNSNNFTVGGGTLSKSEDCPNNVFATLNPLVRVAGNITYSSGNTKIARSGTAEWRTCYSTLAMSTGKYYFEALSDAGANNVIGIRELQNADGSTAGSGNDYPGYTSQGWSLYNQNGTVYNNNATSGSAIGTFTDGDYIGVFLDCDNQKLYFSKNGTMLNTTGYSISAVPYVFGVALYDDGGGFSCNFGNGAFGSTQLTGTTYNGSDGNGIFKYDPNNITLDGSSKSFKSLSTKGLNS